MWESFKEIWPKTFLTTTFLLIIYGFYCGVKMVIKDEKKRRSDKKESKKLNKKGGDNLY